MNRTEKEELVAEMHQSFAGMNIMVLTHYSGLSVAEMTDLRQEMREAGASFRVTKNRLTRLALNGTAYEGLKDMFKGPTAVACSADPVAAAKIAVAYAKKNDKLVILGGGLGDQALDAGGVAALAALPSLDELRAKMVGLLSTPATKVAQVLIAPAGQLARVCGAHGSKDEAA